MEDLMGFQCSEVQKDIGNFLEFGPQYLMIQAQRSQAKTTIVAIYAVWCLIHDPTYRVLVVSAGGTVATEIASWIIQIFMNWDILECMRPDRNHGDRSSSQSFDVNWMLKGSEKSPSVACLGITSSKQGRRADLVIPDDIESSENGATEEQRAKLKHLSLDFTSICQSGRICYLGTPQTVDSIYNDLPARGYTIRIWTGRYPTTEQEKDYGPHLAPFIKERMEADPTLRTGGGVLGDQGKAVDNVIVPEEALQSKELDQGPAYFMLQHMLNTKLNDAERFPIKTKNLLNLEFGLDSAPGEISWLPDKSNLLQIAGLPGQMELYRPFEMGDLYEFESRAMYVDPAGGGKNGDETVAVVVKFLHGYIYVAEMLPLPGGFDESVFNNLSDLALKHKVNKIVVEENFGKGMFAQMWRPVLMKKAKELGLPGACEIEDVWESGQKELRIIETLEPITARHRLIINEEVWNTDIQSVQKYPVQKRSIYMLSHQLQKITRDKGALVHDDRLDALAGAVRIYAEQMAIDETRRIASKATNENVKFMQEWAQGAPESRETSLMPKHSALGRAGMNRGLRSRRR
jgi:hypothetical protein